MFVKHVYMTLFSALFLLLCMSSHCVSRRSACCQHCILLSLSDAFKLSRLFGWGLVCVSSYALRVSSDALLCLFRCSPCPVSMPVAQSSTLSANRKSCVCIYIMRHLHINNHALAYKLMWRLHINNEAPAYAVCLAGASCSCGLLVSEFLQVVLLYDAS